MEGGGGGGRSVNTDCRVPKCVNVYTRLRKRPVQGMNRNWFDLNELWGDLIKKRIFHVFFVFVREKYVTFKS